MNIYLVVEGSWGIDWESQENLEVFRSEEEAEKYIDNKEQKDLTPGVKGREFWIEEFILE